MSELSLTGIGVHSGLSSTVRIHSDADPTQPIRFYRNGQFIPALVSSVVSTERTTTLGNSKVKCSLVEHILAALYIANRWSGLVIEVSQEELPILDGSAQPWYELFAELPKTSVTTQAIQIDKPHEYHQDSSAISISPTNSSSKETRLVASINFEHPAIGQQTWQGKIADFKDLLPARTFVLNEWLEDLTAKQLGLGIREDNCVIIKDDSDLDTLYNFKNEAVMHKALDALGDLFLLGAPLNGEIRVNRGSHRLHVGFARMLFEEVVKNEKNEAK